MAALAAGSSKHPATGREDLIGLLSEIDAPFIRDARPSLARLVNWGGGERLPIHRWYRYREGFSPQLIEALHLGQRILDPFAGGGSILVGSAQAGRSSVGIDVNPLACFVSRVKLSPLAPRDLADVERLTGSLKTRVQKAAPWPAPGLKIADKVFEPEILDTLLRIRAVLEEHATNAAVRDFLLLSWLSILETVGSYFKEGNGIKYRNKKRLKSGYVFRAEGEWQRDRFGDNQQQFVLDRYLAHLGSMLADTSAWRGGNWSQQAVIEGNSMEAMETLSAAAFDSVVFSPPYANRFDYFESMKVELWFGGFVKSYDDMLTLRKRSLRSHLGSDLAVNAATLPEVERLLSLMDPESYAIRMRVPSLVHGYFDDMASVLLACRRVLKPSGRCHVVVGNSAYAGVIIPTDSIIASLGLAAGFDHADVVPVRHLTVAPQQRSSLSGLEGYMRESVVVFS